MEKYNNQRLSELEKIKKINEFCSYCDYTKNGRTCPAETSLLKEEFALRGLCVYAKKDKLPVTIIRQEEINSKGNLIYKILIE